MRRADTGHNFKQYFANRPQLARLGAVRPISVTTVSIGEGVDIKNLQETPQAPPYCQVDEISTALFSGMMFLFIVDALGLYTQTT